MKRKRRSIFLLFILFCSCHTNSISYDLENQEIITCNKQKIRNLFIISEDDSDFYQISLLDGRKGTNRLNLYKLNEDYKVEALTGEIISVPLMLQTKVIYNVCNISFGDAAYSEIKIKTDKIGKVIYSDVISCK